MKLAPYPWGGGALTRRRIMMTNPFDNFEGNNYMFLVCPVCGRDGDVVYRRKRPVYCSAACKQKAYRDRMKRKAKNVTPEEFKDVTNLTKVIIERNLEQALHLMRCNKCNRAIWATRGNVTIGGILCHCGGTFHQV